MRWLIPVVSLYLVSFTSSSPGYWDFCKKPSQKGLLHAMTKHAMPRLGSKAGKFRVIDQRDKRPVDSPLECSLACCAANRGSIENAEPCDVAFYHGGEDKPRCYLVTCSSGDPTGCDPVVKADDPLFRNTVMIQLRRRRSKPTPSFRDRLCSPDSKRASCPKGEQCRPDSRDGDFVCRCSHGQIRVLVPASPYGRCADRPTPPPKPSDVRGQPCEYGVGECPPGEHCVTELEEKKNGMCQCNKGLVRNPQGLCEAPEAASNVTSAPSGTVTPPPILQNSSSSPSPASPTSTSRPTTTLPTPPSSSVSGANTTQAPTSTEKEALKNMTMTPFPLRNLKILLARNYSIQLPVNEFTLRAKVANPPSDPKDQLTYLWSLVSSPDGSEQGVMDGRTTPTFHIAKLVVGEYKFKLVVQGRRSYGEARVEVKVKPATRINKPPVARVKSSKEVVQLPNNLVLDGTQSSDDDKIVDYKWEEVSGPLNQNDLKSTNNGILELKSLTPGDYVFRLTVTDSDGASNSTNVNVTVVKEKDYPPTANAGQNVVLTLPKNSVTLVGNASTDDHGIKSYEWVKVGNDQLTADMTGVREPVLYLKNLQQGDYVFELKVTDTAGQTNTAHVKVYVNPKHNSPPKASAGGDRTVTLPLKIITLDGSKSSDDEKVVKYEWTQVKGPHSLTLKNADTPKLQVSNLKVGQYKFRLTCWDKEKLHDLDTMQLTVQESRNQRPKAHAGGDKLIQLPLNFVELDGSRSWDDKEIVSYHWTRSDDSLAAGTVLNNSEGRSRLLLTSLEPGKYKYKLTVSDAEGLQGSEEVSLVVKEDPNLKNLLEMKFKGNLKEFKQSNKADLVNQLKLLLTKDFPDGDIRINIEGIRQIHNSDSLLLRFFVSKKVRTSNTVLDGRAVLKVLRQRLRSGVALLDLRIERLDTAVCQVTCSGHGKCHPLTGKCVCERFWMQNGIRVKFGDGEYNCDWSILYVIVFCCLGLIFLVACVWFGLWCRRRLRRPRSKRHKYALLNEFDDKDGGLKMRNDVFPLRNGKSKGRTIESDSDLSSDEENTLFVNKRPVQSEAAKAHIRANGEAGL